MSRSVYLSGPITGLTYDGCTDWRGYATRQFRWHKIDALSPLRAKEFLQFRGVITDALRFDDQAMTQDSAITTRDRWDTQRADMLLVNLLGAERVSVGTMIELGWADAARVPICLVMEKEGNIHEHPIVRGVQGFRVDTLDKGIDLIAAALAV